MSTLTRLPARVTNLILVEELATLKDFAELPIVSITTRYTIGYRVRVVERRDVGGYRIERKLGVGGMSTVYEVVDGGGDRYALKLLHPSIAADPNARARLHREVRTLRAVTGPYVASVVDAETEAEEAFIVTELIDGPTLSEDVKDNGVFEGRDLADLAKELADALRAIHSRGVLHRDLKPSNVMMSDRGPVLIDFGIAQIAEESRLTATGLIAHTPGYCAPEVLNGEDPTEAADWWAWAAVLVFAATGHAPFGTGHSPKVTRKVLTGEADLAGMDPVVAYALGAALVPQVERRPSPGEVIGMLDGTIEVSERELELGHVATRRQDRTTTTEGVYGETIIPQYPPAPPTGPASIPPQQIPVEPMPVYDEGGSAIFHSRQDSAVVAHASFDPAFSGRRSPAPMPQWLVPPAKKRLVTVMVWLAFVAWAGAFPVIATSIFTLYHLVASFAGVSHDALTRARLGRGGRFRTENLFVLGRLPLSLGSAAIQTAASVGSGIVIGGGITWLLLANSVVDHSIALVLGTLVGSVIAWLYPTSDPARSATRRMFGSLAPSASYSLFWVVLALALGSLAVAMYSGSDVPDWAPIEAPAMFD